MNAKRALVCAPRVPEFDRESGFRRVFQLIEFLREAGCAVCFIAHEGAGSERYVRLLRQRGVETLLGPGAETDQLIASRRFDIAIFAFWHVAEKYIPVVRRLSPDTRVIVDMIDLHFFRDARNIFHKRSTDPSARVLDSKYASDMAGELNAYAKADGVLAVSQREADLVNDLIDPTLAHVVPDNEDLPASPVPFDQRNGILFIGNFSHHPNVTAAEYLCRDVLPKVDPALLTEHPVYIVGNALDHVVRGYGRNLSNVRFVGWVPSILPYLNRARVSVIPLLTGAGTRRKLIQALMVGTPAVSTSIGTEGLHLKPGKHVLVADDPDRFAESIALLLRDADLWERLRREGRKRVIDAHGRQNGCARLMLALDAILATPPKSVSRTVPNSGPEREGPQEGYQKTIQRIRDVVGAVLPEDATIMVVSNGDDELLKLGERRAWHIPQNEDGVYSGYHPASSNEAISQLETLHKKGGDYLLIPDTGFWWLEYYADFREHLETRYRRIRRDDTCAIFTLRDSAVSTEYPAETGRVSSNGTIVSVPPSLSSQDGLVLSRETIEKLRPAVPETLKEIKNGGQSRRKRQVLVLGVYLAAKQNNVNDIVSVLRKTNRYQVTQRWVALGGEPLSNVADLTVSTILRERPKFQIMNDLLANEKLSQYEYVVLIDDDVVLPDSFLDHFISLQERLAFSIAQPARTSNSYIVHPIVEQQRGVMARRTLFVEIGPVVSFHKNAYDLVFPFDLTSPMGWGYENVWAYRLDRSKMKIGIIDVVPVDHSLRKPVALYRWDEAHRQRSLFLAKHPHIPIDQCFRVLDLINLSEPGKEHGHAAAAH